MIRLRHGVVIGMLAAIAACIAVDADFSMAQSAPPRPSVGHADIPEVPRPDITRVDPSVQEQIHAAQNALAAAIAQADATSVLRANAFGHLGQIYQAYGFDDAALACYRNAARLDDKSFRWSYHSGYLNQEKGDVEAAEQDYQRALILQPADNPALLRLGALELNMNHLDAARQWFTQAMGPQNPSAAALAGLGKVALLEHQYADALKYFDQALAREPQASSIHYQLAMAYRGLGDLAHMQEQLKARGNVEPAIQDALLDEIDVLKQGKFGLLERGNAAMHEARFSDAVDIYRQMVSLDPSDPVTYKFLGVALARSGQPEEALKQYARALQLDPNNATVHYNTGILQIEAGNEEQAIAHFQKALQLDPGLVAAHFQLANLLMRNSKDADAEREYAIVVSLEPQNGFARLMQAMAAVHAGAYARARKLLEESNVAFPEDTTIANALARLLAAAPDPAVRDQNRALGIVETLVRNQEGDALEIGITLAMALAAVGRFQEAAGYQQAIIHQLEDSGEFDIARRLRPDLVRYQEHKTCRTPWANDDPVFTPVPSTAQLSTESRTRSMHP